MADDEAERSRLYELRNLELLDTPPEERFDRYTRLVADVLDAPVALVSLIDRDRQWIKSGYGAQTGEMDRDVAICDYAAEAGFYEVPDLAEDGRFAGNPIVRGPPQRRFYAGVRLRGPQGGAMGALCVFGHQTRQLTQREWNWLGAFGELVERELAVGKTLETVRSEIDRTLMRDPLTELPGPLLLDDYADHWITQLDPAESLVAAHFQVRNQEAINRAYGRDVGDQLLRIVARRAHEAAPASAIVARLSGARVVVLMAVDGTRPDIESQVLELERRMATATDVAPDTISPELVVGVATAPADASDGPNLIDRARHAVREAEEDERDTVLRFYSRSTDMEPRHFQRIPFRLREAAANGDIRVVFQPMRDLNTDRLVALEALARWQDEALGEVVPDSFIPHVEAEPRLARLVTQQVLEAACARALALDDNGVCVSVNVTARDLYQPDFAEFVLGVIDQAGLTRERVVLELTEQSLIADIEHATRTLHWLGERGIRCAIDDFGTGYSSLSYLRELPVQVLKMDRRFVAEMEAYSGGDSVAAGIVTIGRSLGLQVVAEGIETSADLVRARAMGCDIGQGYLLGRPVTGEDLAAGIQV